MSDPGMTSIPSHKLARVANLAGAGARVGTNYLKHFGRKILHGDAPEEDLHSANAETVYRSFATLKGGPLKMAQMLSIDRNLLPKAYREKFALAQYSAPPLSYPLVAKTFRRELGRDPLDLFDEFCPVAAHGASIGQVHRARKDGRDYAVKIQYPGVATSVRSDLALVKPIALQMLGLKAADVEEYFHEVQERLLEETDYTLELQRSIDLSHRSAHLPGIRFPVYFPEWSSRRVLTMEWIDGLPLDRFADEEPGQEARDRVAQAIWDFYHHQVHSLLQFHADPHPGNFLVLPDGTVAVLDFGCTKTISPEFHRSYFELLKPDVLQSGDRFAAALTDLGILQPGDAPRLRLALIEKALEGSLLLSRPFHVARFDFGDPSYMESIFSLGERNRQDPDLLEIGPTRGPASALYLNRAYFGLYSLMGRLRARIRARIPDAGGFGAPPGKP
jgi:predicted unusual protein kinase regulating ubiquinone biosynthesis (AarF/ABC1/UbiB family)